MAINTNHLSNAMKFVVPGAIPEVEVSAENRDGFVRLAVRDRGIRIAPEYHGKIFTLFERLNAGKSYPGTGAGLAIVKKAVERMNGRLGFESEPGRGSTFWIDLPEAQP